MKKAKIGLGVFLGVILIGSLFFSTVHAQVDYTIWEDTWFKLNVAVKGYERNLGGTPDWLPDNGKFTAFLHIGVWTDPDGSIEGDEFYAANLYYYDEDTAAWLNRTLFPGLSRVHGNPLDILVYSSWGTGSVASGTLESIRFMARITGKLDKTGNLAPTSKLKSLAGSHTKLDPLNPLGPLYQGAGLTITGSLIIPATFCTVKKNQTVPPLPPCSP
jgi:hypothetical protein